MISVKSKLEKLLTKNNFSSISQTSWSKKTPQGHNLTVTLSDKIHLEWRDRAGLKEGWIQQTFSYTSYGLRKFSSILMSLL
jgi:hypothetical protein